LALADIASPSVDIRDRDKADIANFRVHFDFDAKKDVKSAFQSAIPNCYCLREPSPALKYFGMGL